MNRRASCSAAIGLLFAAWAAAGCCCARHSVGPVADDLAEACGCIAPCGRGHVHVFFVQGVDPLDCANLEGVKEYVQSLGFGKAWFGHHFHVRKLAAEMARVQGCDPEARFVVVGFAHGTDAGQELAVAAGKHGVSVDLLVRLDGHHRRKDFACRPENVKRVITILAAGCKGNCAVGESDDVHVTPARAFAAPTHPDTLDLLVRELAALAGNIPAVDDLPRPCFLPHAPPAHPLAARAGDGRDDWDFLAPASVEDRPLPSLDDPPPARRPRPAPEQRRALR